VVAEPAVQRLYAELIEKLDQRRAQVLVEARFVSIDTSNDFSLGVEISGITQNGTKKMLAFSSYGLSTTSATTGALTLIPGTGFNGTLVDPNVADVVVRALNKSSRAKTMSSPRILINDNANGQLTSVKEVPYSSVNASTTVATTTFAGFADAGTTITVTPHISDDSRLQMDVRITINTFTGSASNNLPPPRQTQEVSSQITIPDGYTAIIGGLDLNNKSYTYSGIPYLEQIPLVRELTGLTTTSRSKSAMFVFLHPIILRDDKFQGLKFLSEDNLRKADIQQDFPNSQPIWIQ
jgi:general secretion pathway protein D